MRDGKKQDQGVAMVSYALIVVLVAIVSVGVMQTVGQSTSDSFETVAGSVPGETSVQVNLSPEEKWEKAKEDYQNGLAEAKATKSAEIAQAAQDKTATVNKAKADYSAAREDNKSLSSADRKAANKTAKNEFNAAKKAANQTYKAAKSAANQAYKATVITVKSDYNSAKADWKAYQKSK